MNGQQRPNEGDVIRSRNPDALDRRPPAGGEHPIRIPRILASVARVLGTLAAFFLSAYLGVWFCCRILMDLGKGLTDSSFLVCFFANSIILTLVSLIIRARWWESMTPLPVPLVTAALISVMAGQDHYAGMILFAFGLPIVLSAAGASLLGPRTGSGQTFR